MAADGHARTNGHGVLHAGPLEIRPAEHVALVRGRPLTFTVRELQLLIALAHRADQVVSRSDLYGSVWEGEFRSYDRSVDVYVSKLRAKLEAALPDWRYIHTHFGFGYRFSPVPLHDFHSSLTER
jgi:DNA-binding response OmpR family regulator